MAYPVHYEEGRIRGNCGVGPMMNESEFILPESFSRLTYYVVAPLVPLQ